MYCGDGINDLAALAAADVGMAVGSSDASAAASVITKQNGIAGAISLPLLCLCLLKMPFHCCILHFGEHTCQTDVNEHVGMCTVIREARAGQSIKLNAVKVSASAPLGVCPLGACPPAVSWHSLCTASVLWVAQSFHTFDFMSKGLQGIDESLPHANACPGTNLRAMKCTSHANRQSAVPKAPALE